MKSVAHTLAAETQALTGAEADAMQARLARMHARDRERVAQGLLAAGDLHLIPADMARRSRVVLSSAATSAFKARR